MELVDALREVALASGCSAVGVAGVDHFADVEASLLSRRDFGLSAKLRFTYRDPAVATDVRRTFSWARAFVVAAHPYLPAGGAPGPDRPGTGTIARFATADHYRPLRAALDRMADLLHDAGHKADVLCDDSRLVDRAAAVRAGVGWWGKNTMVLAPATGPWTLLGSVVTDAGLPPDRPMDRDCGRCDACLPACPTGALVAPGVLDVGRCLAYWLQTPGVIPRSLRRAMGDRVYGCDDCLTACPPGRRLADGSVTSAGRVSLRRLLEKDDTTLLAEYDHFYIPRRQPRYLRRNALVALGNTGGRGASALAARFVEHGDWLLRVHAVWAVDALGGSEARSVLEAAAGRERDERVLAELAAAGVL